MKEALISARSSINRFLYKTFVKRVFFCFDPERVHDGVILWGRFLGRFFITRKITSFLFSYSHKSLEQNILGIEFKNPIGLSAGFDKDALLTDIIPFVGFGFEEAGSITGEACSGNPGTRLWRLKKSRALVVYYGLKNEGCEKIAHKLKNKKFYFPVGISVAKTNDRTTVKTDAGINDYAKAYKAFVDVGIGDYFTINISCPNVYGGQPFNDADSLGKLLDKIDTIDIKKPVFIKLPPDLSEQKVNEIIEVARRHHVDGFVCSNLTKDRENKKMMQKITEKDVPEAGGISGKPMEDLANDLIGYIYKKTKGEFIIIGCGGVFSAEDAYKKIKLGASLIQLITGMVFEGPQLVGEINQGLVRLLKKDGFDNISQAVGSGTLFT